MGSRSRHCQCKPTLSRSVLLIRACRISFQPTAPRLLYLPAEASLSRVLMVTSGFTLLPLSTIRSTNTSSQAHKTSSWARSRQRQRITSHFRPRQSRFGVSLLSKIRSSPITRSSPTATPQRLMQTAGDCALWGAKAGRPSWLTALASTPSSTIGARHARAKAAAPSASLASWTSTRQVSCPSTICIPSAPTKPYVRETETMDTMRTTLPDSRQK